jgi:hypothetical protein
MDIDRHLSRNAGPRALRWLALPLLLMAVPGFAQRAETPSGGIAIGGEARPARERCVDVEIGGEHAFGCLNQELKRQADRANPTLNVPPIDAKSSDIRVGVFNEPGVRQQYGQNFGRSVVPYRPPPPIFSAPGGPRR